MIGRLTGRIVECTPGSVVVDVLGVGYDVQIPLSTFYEISGRNGPITLQIHTHLREDLLQLFGFATVVERAAFQRLLAISGVGPRLALAVLSGIGVTDLEQAVQGGDRVRLERIPGVGRKTAERILLELKDRLGSPKSRRRLSAAVDDAHRDADGRIALQADAVSALVNLGYSPDSAAQAVEAARESQGGGAVLESVLKEALKRLVR